MPTTPVAFPSSSKRSPLLARHVGVEAPLVDLHPDRPDQRGVQLPSGTIALLPPEPTFDQITAAGGRIVLSSEPHPVAGLFVGSGQIERVTQYETGLVGHYTFRGDRGEPDPLILDERLLAAHVRGRGVSVLSACSHAGVVNACPHGERVVLWAADRCRARRLPPGGLGDGAEDQ